MPANLGTQRLPAIAKPGTNPAASTGELYNKAGTKKVYWLDEDGVDFDLTPSVAASSATIVVGTEVPNSINVTIQLKDAAAADLVIRCGVRFYLADDANGDTPSATAPDGGIVIGTDGVMIEWLANLSGMLVSEADGDIDITLTESGVATWYLVVVLPSGALAVSAAITFA